MLKGKFFSAGEFNGLCLVGSVTPVPWHIYIQRVWNVWIQASVQPSGTPIFKESGMFGLRLHPTPGIHSEIFGWNFPL